MICDFKTDSKENLLDKIKIIETWFQGVKSLGGFTADPVANRPKEASIALTDPHSKFTNSARRTFSFE